MEKTPNSHVLIFPAPFQGHVNTMLNLAELLSLSGLAVTFVNSEHNHRLLLQHTGNVQARFTKYPGFKFQTISDGLAPDHPRSGNTPIELLESMSSNSRPLLKQLLVDQTCNRTPVNCIIGDGILGWIIDVADEVKIPIISFRTISACCFWVYFCIPEIIQAQELPIRENEGMDRRITTVPGMETLLRLRDLPSFCQVRDITDRDCQWLVTETRKTVRANSLILNTFEDLEGPILSHIRTKCPNIYTIGPLHLNLKTRLGSDKTSFDDIQSSSNSTPWEVDRSCITWLDKQPPQSVVYVSFGSITTLTRSQLMEFWHGLVNSKKRFLWVIRPDTLVGPGENESFEKLWELMEGRGYMVGWAPQEEVLAHQAVGGFLTHNGWNSTLESIVARQPMICWPYFADQQVNSRFVGEVWRLGLDMKDVCDRKVVEKMVNDLMVERREEIVKSTDRMAKLAKKSVSDGGSSFCNLDRMIKNIRLMSV
ncbi:hypothetical protein Ddye_027407 [Dipteronia dyeriana]|uniref:7-deoxyloganetic acid glucosyltransferase n=1 Tax=Dipteronia dyeriana TaxID=168575 RepID=A0AAD9TPH3_9ROSI|nr:hypothetical protein Ddye_027407 [Dipteronia dyeriana]